MSYERLLSDQIFSKDGESLDVVKLKEIPDDISEISWLIRSEMIKLNYFENPYALMPSLEANSIQREEARMRWIESIKHCWRGLGGSKEQKRRTGEQEIRQVEEYFNRPTRIRPIEKLRPGWWADDLIYTQTGAEQRTKWLGFRDYLQTAERFRMDEEKIETFSKYLPYAIALGVETKWAKRFEDININRLEWFRLQDLETIKRHDEIYFKHVMIFLGQINTMFDSCAFRAIALG